jgi:lipoprotein-anchoring transpeptidase ErfK/SrfK
MFGTLMRTPRYLFAALLLTAGTACGGDDDRIDAEVARIRDTASAAGTLGARDSVATADSAARPADTTVRRAPLPIADVRIEVDTRARELHLRRGDALLATHPVAVGSAEWPTRTGEWHIVQVVWNPEWNPPDESWAEQRQPRKPGDPANPLGHAQLVYDPPRSIHGTNDPASIGKAVSHGSIRVTNAVAKELGRQLMEATGAGRGDAWYERVQRNRTEKVIVDLPMLVPIRVF